MICISIGSSDFESTLKLIEGFQIAEIRLDISNYGEKEIREIFSGKCNLIATCRPGKIPDEKRKEMLSIAVEAGASFLDLELDVSDSYKNDLIEIARKNKCAIIVSYHNYEKTPFIRELEEIVSWCYNSGADIAKVACRVRSKADCARMLSLYNNEKKIISIGLGIEGRITRIIAPFMGAPFTYASISPGKKTGDGQMDVETLQKYLEIFKGV